MELRCRGDIEDEAMEHWCRGEIGSDAVELRCRLTLEVLGSGGV